MVARRLPHKGYRQFDIEDIHFAKLKAEELRAKNKSHFVVLARLTFEGKEILCVVNTGQAQRIKLKEEAAIVYHTNPKYKETGKIINHLSREDRIKIIEALNAGGTPMKIARRLGVKWRSVYYIRNLLRITSRSV